MPNVKVSSRVFDGTKKRKEAEKKPKLRYSGYFLTIVSNVVNGKDNKVLEKFTETVKGIFEGDAILEYIEGEQDKIESVDAETSIELNGRRFPHCHALVKIKHRTNVRMPYDKLRKAVAEGLGVSPSSLHIYCRLIKDANFSVQNYLMKHVKTEDAR